MIVLAGDIGGTNVRLALFRGEERPLVPFARARVSVAEHDGLVRPVADFLAAQKVHADLACLGIAGTVESRCVQGVNLPWPIDADELEREAAIGRVTLVNDFYAAARGVPLLDLERDAFQLGGGELRADHPTAVIGAGTGLGEAFLVPTPAGPQVMPTEGGHRAFAPQDALQDQLLAYLRARHGHVSTERVLSGPGLVAIHAFLVEQGQPGSPEVTRAEDSAREIANRALAGEDPTCRQALELFVRVYGAEAADATLTVLAGTVFLAGGIAPQILREPALQRLFRASFEDKGRFRGLLERVPVYVVTTDDLGLVGAAGAALDG